MTQRISDILFSLLAIIVLFPLFVLITILLLFTGENNVFFLQKRIGKDFKIFKLIKFTTMKKGSPNIGSGTVTVKNDPRILKFGKFLRFTKINELPQLFNILLGDMSLIGPRPLTKQTFDCYSDEVKKIVSQVKPGLSGVGSIIFRAEEEFINGDEDPLYFYTNVIAPYKGKVEQWFVKNNNLKVYYLSIFITIIVIFNSQSKIAWYCYKGLPKPPSKLKSILNYPY
jgi:lipopolysaccharide/colanic/teichoic acid biosynthesis glycosyltransferase